MSLPASAIRSPARSRRAARHRSRRRRQERGVCCLTQSLCTCTPYTCRSTPSSSFCQCGSVVALAAVTLGRPVAECPAPAARQKCCFSQDNAQLHLRRPAVRRGRNPGGELFSDRRRSLRSRGGDRRMPMRYVPALLLRVVLARRSRRRVRQSCDRDERSRTDVDARQPVQPCRRMPARSGSGHRRSRPRRRRDDGQRHRGPGDNGARTAVQVPLRTHRGLRRPSAGAGPAQPAAGAGAAPVRGESSWVGRVVQGARRRQRRCSYRRAIWSCAAAASSSTPGTSTSRCCRAASRCCPPKQLRAGESVSGFALFEVPRSFRTKTEIPSFSLSADTLGWGPPRRGADPGMPGRLPRIIGQASSKTVGSKPRLPPRLRPPLPAESIKHSLPESQFRSVTKRPLLALSRRDESGVCRSVSRRVLRGLQTEGARR